MTPSKLSSLTGASSAGTTAIPPASPSSNVENPSTSDTLDITAKKNPTSQPTVNLTDVPNVIRLLIALSVKLGTLAEWKMITLKDGRHGWMLFFSDRKWKVGEDGQLTTR